MKKKKPRQFGILFRVKEAAEAVGVRFSRDGGILNLVDKDGSPIELDHAQTELSYPRKKGPKVIYRAETDPASPTIDFQKRLRDAERVFAIDTNSFEFEGESVALISYLECTIQKGGRAFKVPNRECWEVRNLTVDAEKYGWATLCENLVSGLPNGEKSKIAIVVDSHLGELEEINSGKRPILGNYFKPVGIEFVYSTSDVANDTLGNVLIRMCDSAAKAIRREIEAGSGGSNWRIEQKEGGLFSRAKPWFFTPEKE